MRGTALLILAMAGTDADGARSQKETSRAARRWNSVGVVISSLPERNRTRLSSRTDLLLHYPFPAPYRHRVNADFNLDLHSNLSDVRSIADDAVAHLDAYEALEQCVA